VLFFIALAQELKIPPPDDFGAGIGATAFKALWYVGPGPPIGN
jgi:hypothetical protein